MNFKTFAFIFVAFILGFVASLMLLSNLGTKSITKPQNSIRTVILTNFGSIDDDGNWHGEVAPFMREMKNQNNVSEKFASCSLAYEGNIFDQKILVVVSGMGKTRTSACVTDILHEYKGGIEEIILEGIAGISPDPIVDGQKSMIGDVCVGSVSFDFDLQHYSSDQAGTVAPNPEFWQQSSDHLAKVSYGNSDLADKIVKLSGNYKFPETPENVYGMNMKYQGYSRTPTIWEGRDCISSTGDLYWHDTKADLLARKVGVGYINLKYGTQKNSNDIFIVTAMEAVSASSVVDWWNAANDDDIAFSYVRGVSNFSHPWLNEDGTPGQSGRDSIQNPVAKGGSNYAIETAALPVLNYLHK